MVHKKNFFLCSRSYGMALLCIFLLGPLWGAWAQDKQSTSRAQLVCAKDWPAWEYFKQRFIDASGRVIDDSDERLITTSEGQSYALFFALLANDQQLFDQLLRWSIKHLAQGDLSRQLPAWLWGQQPSGEWGVLDQNSAADSDLWIAYSLLEAGRLWRVREYTLLAHELLRQIMAREVVKLPGFGILLLPGEKGFAREQVWRFNPSYLPPQLVHRIALFSSAEDWLELAESTTRFLIQTAPLGVAPDWVVWDGHQWIYPSSAEQWASYNAIRVYLWVGLLDEHAQGAKDLKGHFSQGLAFIQHDYKPVEQIQVLQGTGQGMGPVGFSAALLPLFEADDFGQAQRERIADSELESLGYYGSALLLFGQGWADGHYYFDAQGFVVPKWMDCQ